MAAATPAGLAAGMGMEHLNAVLWHERDLLEDLLFALETEQWVLANRHARWFRHAADRVHAANDRLRDAEVLRAAEADAVATALGLGPAPSLSQLADSAGEPWRTILLEQRTVLLAAAADITGFAGPTGTRPGAGAVRETVLAAVGHR